MAKKIDQIKLIKYLNISMAAVSLGVLEASV
ncbi:hypothetical protein Mal64_28950 [Pseudobythopirellula maris]|uniref:Uncharacterized protein n=1 Tax=Pseudobythopirellula maris TaxID=2527991 RepID=A0A5C5ZJC5_9BACT|nr:hypothetical protein Mal64_28950 [Pseudobythopirellula maris]